MASFASQDDHPLTDPGTASEAWVADPFDDPGLDDSGDAELADFIARAQLGGSGREKVSALSALSQQMDQYKPLPPAEQLERFHAHSRGLEAAAVLKVSKRLGERKRRALELEVAAGEHAHTELVGSMFRLVLLISRELAAGRHGRERSLEMLADLVADANVALVEAVSKYEPERGIPFSIYAGRAIRERVRASVSHTGLIDIPASWLRVRRLATTLAPELASDLGRPPTVEEMQEGLRRQCMNWARAHLTESQMRMAEPERIELMKAKLVKQGMLGAIDRYEEVMTATQALWNLDAPVGSDGSTRLMDLVTDTPASETFDVVELSELRDNLFKALDGLPERDREIVLYRFGFVDGEVWTYARLAPLYKISAERVRQIERGALTRLRGPGFEALGGFLPSTL